MIVKKLSIETYLNEDEVNRDSAEVVIEAVDGARWRASFVTIGFLQRQMYLSGEAAKDTPDMAPVRFVAIETPHVIVENLVQETIEETVENLIAFGTFESVFTRYEEEALLKSA